LLVKCHLSDVLRIENKGSRLKLDEQTVVANRNQPFHFTWVSRAMNNKKALFFFLLFTGGAHSEEIPVASLAHQPLIEQPAVSPGGKYIVAVLNAEDGPTVVVSEFGSRDLQAVLKLKKSEDRIEWVRWANEERILVSASYSRAFSRVRVRIARLFSVDRDGSNLQELSRRTARVPLVWTRWLSTGDILSMLPDEPEYVLLELYDDQDDAWAVFKVDIYKNKFYKQFVNNYEVDSWYADTYGRVSFGIGWDKDIVTTWYRSPGSEGFHKLHSRKLFEDETFAPIMIDGDSALVLSDHELGRQAIWRYNIADGAFEDLIFAADGYDVSDAIRDQDETKVIGAAYIEHYEKRHYFDESESSIYRTVVRSFPEYQTHIVSHDRDWTRLIVLAVRDDSPPKYFWLDLPEKRGGLWFSSYPDLEKATLTKVQPFEFEARDGMKLNGYLTLPQRADGRKPPLVVFPHGGPHSRDRQNFDPFVQFFASRGYAVLQVNFRGSEGFNSAYERAGYREWGRAMQHDVYDAIDWLQSQGLTEESSTCVVGASYGGYVALTAAYQRPRQFKCIVSISGVADLIDMVDISLVYGETAKISEKKTVGDPGNSEQKTMLRENSPINHVEKIKSPILLIHGTYDTQVRVQQSRDLYQRADSAGLDIEYLELERATHYFDDHENRLAMFQALETFLAAHL
jgi:dipeptidyl aminopeptidase/acylaminoacyl peptidase